MEVEEPVLVEPEPEPIVVRRVVASPRVAVAPHPNNHPVTSLDEWQRCCRTIGAAYNFPRPPRRMLVKPGTHVFVQLGNDIEGVWYDGACGWLGAFINLDVFNDTTQRWEPVGTNYRTAKACGPNWGTAANMGVRFPVGDSGTYLLRARVISFALPLRRDLSFDRYLYACRDVEVDYIFTQVRVVEDPTDDDIDWEAG